MTTESHAQIVLVEEDDDKRAILAGRLQAQRFIVRAFGDPAVAAGYILGSAPDAVVADVWMTGVSGVQLCRLLKSEPAAEHVPIILRAEGDSPKNRFWAEHAGAVAYVPKGRIGQLVRALNSAIKDREVDDGFFAQLASYDIRDRIAQHLDRALFESVIASEVRALSSCENFERLFDLFSQFACQVLTYRWLAVTLDNPGRLGLHCNAASRESSEAAAREALNADGADLMLIQDEDAVDESAWPNPLILPIKFGQTPMGKLAVSVVGTDADAEALVGLMSRELGGPLRIVTLVEESQRLAQYDPLTGIMNRRAFATQFSEDLCSDGEYEPLALILLDIDHFKSINDAHGHMAGDEVLRALGKLLAKASPPKAKVARWGGEEFVVAFRIAAIADAVVVAEQVRSAIEHCVVNTENGVNIPVSASLGVALCTKSETMESLVERADKAMYAAKLNGRNRVESASDSTRTLPRRSRVPDGVVPPAESSGYSRGGEFDGRVPSQVEAAIRAVADGQLDAANVR